MRLTSAALLALAAASTPAAAQSCDCGAAPYTEVGPAYLVVPRTTYLPRLRSVTETVLVPRTHYERRVVYVPRTRLVPRTVAVQRTTYRAVTRYDAYPASGAGYPAGYRYGATYVPPGTSYPCLLGTIGCDSSAVGPLGY